MRVTDDGRELTYQFDDVLKYHGGGSPGGAALAFKALELALPLLDPENPCERREIVIETPFKGSGARDAFEIVARAVTEERFHVDPQLERPDLGRARERFVFRLGYRGRSATLTLKAGFVTDEFIDLARTQDRTRAQEQRLTKLKQELADRVMAARAADVYDFGA
jgi:hypothetical protein